MAEAALPCIVCGHVCRNVDSFEVTNQPYQGTAFTSPGHYGSTVFDPMNGEFLEVTVCDACLSKAGEAGRVLTARSRKPVTHDGSRIGWARADQNYIEWRPGTAHYDDAVEVDDWDEWERLRESYGLESWLDEEHLREVFAEHRAPNTSLEWP